MSIGAAWAALAVVAALGLGVFLGARVSTRAAEAAQHEIKQLTNSARAAEAQADAADERAEAAADELSTLQKRLEAAKTRAATRPTVRTLAGCRVALSTADHRGDLLEQALALARTEARERSAALTLTGVALTDTRSALWVQTRRVARLEQKAKRSKRTKIAFGVLSVGAAAAIADVVIRISR